MTFLSVVERELRVSSRRGMTYWGRVACAAAFILLAFGFMASEYRVPVARLSHDLFVMLSVIGWFGALIIGVLATADCISCEKRDGTLGLLFLTDLRGYDVIFGKLLAGGVGAIFGLLATLPVLALPVLMGGVSAAQFFEVEMTIVLALVYAMSASIMVSTLARSGRKAYVVSLLLVAFLTIGVVALEGAWMTFHRLNFPEPIASRISPFVSFMTCVEPRTAVRGSMIFWHSIAGTLLQILLFWVVAATRVPRAWQDRATTVRGMQWRERLTRWSLGSAAGRKAYRATMLDRSPICWLDDRYRFLKTGLWAALLAGTVFWMWLYRLEPTLMLGPGSIILTGVILNNVLVMWITFETCQRFAEDRRTGAFELLLGTTLSVRDILRGRLLSLRRQFGWAILAILLAEGILLAGVLRMMKHNNWWHWDDTALLIGITLAGMMIFVLETVAVIATGLWASLTSGSAMMAIVKTFLRVVVLHWAVFLGWLAAYSFVIHFLPPKNAFRGGSMEEFSVLAAWFGIGLLVCLSATIVNGLRVTRRLRQVVSEPRRAGWWRRLPGLRS